MIPAAKVHASISFLCDARELRFLYDLMQDNPRDPGDHPVPEFHALLVALERMWGGAEAKHLTVTSGLMYDLVTYAMRAHRMHENPAGWRLGSGHEVRIVLQGLMESVARAIKHGSIVKRKDDGVYLDLFRIPPGFTMRW
jgi:hypothetical protein